MSLDPHLLSCSPALYEQDPQRLRCKSEWAQV